MQNKEALGNPRVHCKVGGFSCPVTVDTDDGFQISFGIPLFRES